MAITALPTPPSRQDPTNFAARGDAFFGAFPQFVADANALQSDVNAKQQAAALSQIAAAASQAAAAASQSAASVSANLAAASAGAALWVSGTNYAAGFVVYSALTGRSYRRLVAGAGTTDPSVDTANWRPLLLDIDTGYPSILPGLNLDFANSKILDPRITFSRASTATYYDGKTVAKADENLLTFSEQFNNLVWSSFGTSPGVIANSGIAPDGVSQACRIVFQAADSRWRQGVNLVNGATYTLSLYVKSNTGGNQTFRLWGQDASFNSSDLTATAAWQRFTFTFTATGTANYAHGIRTDSANSASDLLIWGAQFEQRSQAAAYTPTTSAPITNYIPVLKTAQAGVPRFDHHPITGESLGLLIEEQRTNLLTYSEQFDNAAWGKMGSAASSNACIAPDGTLTADKLLETNLTNSQYYFLRIISANAGVSYSISIYAKAGERSQLGIQSDINSGFVVGIFNLLTGAVINSPPGWSMSSAYAGNGWYRFSVTFTSDATAQKTIVIQPILAGANFYNGNSLSGIYIWGAQLEAGAFATSYIQTTGAQVTRVADVVSMTGANFSSWYRQDEGSLFAEVIRYTENINGRIAWIDDSTQGSNYVNFIQLTTLNSLITYNVGLNSSTQANETLGGISLFSPRRVAVSYKNHDHAGSVAGGAVVTNASGLVPYSMNLLWIGCHRDGTALNGTIKSIRYYPKRLSNSELQALTS